MLKEIPNKPNHKIVGYKKISSLDGKLPSLYEPIYERILPLNKVYWDNSRNERIYLISDTQGITCEGQFVEVETRQLGHLDTADQEMFFELLSHNGYEIKDGKLKFHLNYGDVFMTSQGAIVIYLSDGCHNSINKTINCILERRADEFETEVFFNSLKSNGFTYNPVTKCISESERYYYFPSYSLYKGFQPEKRKWIDSTVDKFFEKHLETYDTFRDCANWCNIINSALKRDYPEIKLEE